jgi:hypothetical protein
MKFATKTREIVDSVAHELAEKPPSVLASTRKKFGPAKAKAQKTAILLNKSRRMGAKIPKPKSMGSY